jgi:hypothetical protein
MYDEQSKLLTPPQFVTARPAPKDLDIPLIMDEDLEVG